MVDSYTEDGTWSHIASPDVGWVSNEYLFFQTADGAGTSVMLDFRQALASAPLTVRNLPSPEGAPVDEVAAGTPVLAVATTLDGQWRQVVQPVQGWVAANDFPAALE
jgi:hypothetical protein